MDGSTQNVTNVTNLQNCTERGALDYIMTELILHYEFQI